MIKQIRQAEQAPYDILYAAKKDHILWGNNPGRLIPRIPEFSNGCSVLDAGCGDGRNALYLEKHGYLVTGCDVSSLALEGLSNRFKRAQWNPKGSYKRMNLLYNLPERNFDILLSYGLFHCLPSAKREQAHRILQSKIVPGGIMIFSSLTDRIPLPKEHYTDGVSLVSENEVYSLFEGWQIEYREENIISESHYPLIGEHRHSGIWLIGRRIL